MVKQFG